MKELVNLILSAQESDEDSMQEIIKTFEPIINKYTRKMKYDEDFRSDLTLHLIKTIYAIDLSKFKIQNDYSIINYIRKALHNKYIILSKKRSNLIEHENHFEGEDIEEWLGEDNSTTDDINYIIIDDLMKSTLSEREYTCVKLMVIDGLSSTQAAKILHISRQTVNAAKIRALNKLKIVFCGMP